MPSSYEDLMQAAVADLLSARRLINEEIASYPTPISGCDAQFNHLLAMRQRIGTALAAMDVEVFIPTPRAPTPLSGVESR